MSQKIKIKPYRLLAWIAVFICGLTSLWAPHSIAASTDVTISINRIQCTLDEVYSLTSPSYNLAPEICEQLPQDVLTSPDNPAANKLKSASTSTRTEGTELTSADNSDLIHNNIATTLVRYVGRISETAVSAQPVVLGSLFMLLVVVGIDAVFLNLRLSKRVVAKLPKRKKNARP